MKIQIVCELKNWYLMGYKTLWKKKEIAVTSQGLEKSGLFWKELKSDPTAQHLLPSDNQVWKILGLDF